MDDTLGFMILGLLGLQGLFMRFSPGSLRIQKPDGGATAWIYNILNLGFLLGLTPLIAFCLIGGFQDILEWGQLQSSAIKPVPFQFIGIVCYVSGNGLLYWSRVVLGKSFRLGAVPPKQTDCLVISGPFRHVRHPMYSAVVLMSFGLSLILFNWVLLVFTLVFLAVIIRMIPLEEIQLTLAYNGEYRSYQSRTRRLIPWVY
jgi:protein-S-isoprenylcysteine O-methyltransferase Ste14